MKELTSGEPPEKLDFLLVPKLQLGNAVFSAKLGLATIFGAKYNLRGD
jgi:hypothetical protein